MRSGAGYLFHPEKRGGPGLQILQNFYKICQEAAHV